MNDFKYIRCDSNYRRLRTDDLITRNHRTTAMPLFLAKFIALDWNALAETNIPLALWPVT